MKKAKENSSTGGSKSTADAPEEGDNSDAEEKAIEMSDDDEPIDKMDSTTPITPLDRTFAEGLKRKRDADVEEGDMNDEDPTATPKKVPKSETPPAPPAPPPPPAPAHGSFLDVDDGGGVNGCPDEMEADTPVDTAAMAMSTTSPSSSGHLGLLNEPSARVPAGGAKLPHHHGSNEEAHTGMDRNGLAKAAGHHLKSLQT